MAGIDPKGTSLVIQPSALSQTENPRETVEVSPFLETSDGGMLVTESDQKNGTYWLGAVASEPAGQENARLTVISAPTLIDQNVTDSFTNLNNMDIFMNAVTANYEGVSNTSIPAKSLQVQPNVVTHGGLWSLLLILVVPLASIITGMIVWMRRRKL